jgi:hypothetical protein
LQVEPEAAPGIDRNGDCRQMGIERKDARQDRGGP